MITQQSAMYRPSTAAPGILETTILAARAAWAAGAVMARAAAAPGPRPPAIRMPLAT